MTRRILLERAAVALATMTLTFVFLINLCGLLYHCGCQSIWNGAADRCNIHQQGVRHCPWCSHGDLGYYTVLALILIPQLAISVSPGRWSWRARLVASLAAFPLLGGVIALAMGWMDGYW
ncbi:MAG: hypothetical protein JSU00_23870 [Acidobacteria bacterium]|nr:hypothetical protein [Acidobacteriota bacterium]